MAPVQADGGDFFLGMDIENHFGRRVSGTGPGRFRDQSAGREPNVANGAEESALLLRSRPPKEQGVRVGI